MRWPSRSGAFVTLPANAPRCVEKGRSLDALSFEVSGPETLIEEVGEEAGLGST